MDERLRNRLVKIEKQIQAVYEAEEAYLSLDSAKEHMKASLMMRAEGTSQAAKEMIAVATTEWSQFTKGLALAESRFHREKHMLELKHHAFNAEYLSMKLENAAIIKQGEK